MAKTKAQKKARQRGDKPTDRMTAAPIESIGVVGGRKRFRRTADGAILELQLRNQGDGHAKVLRNVATEPLEYYFRRKTLTVQQFKAAATLRAAFQTAGLFKVGSVNLEPSSRSASSDNWRYGERQAAALKDYMQAMRSAGRVSRIFLRHVCCMGEWAIDVAKVVDLPERFGIDRLREALDDLADHYRNPKPLDPVKRIELEDEMKRVLGDRMPKAAMLDAMFAVPI